MQQKYEVLTRYVHDGKSFRQIAAEVGIHRGTVSKYVKEYEQTRAKLLESREDGHSSANRIDDGGTAL